VYKFTFLNLLMSFGWAVYLQVLHPQGKNPNKEDEFSAVGDMLLLGIPNIIPWHPEDQNDLAQPAFLGIQGVPASTSQTMVASGSKPDPHGPCSPEQLTKAQKMVAWLSFSL
jgi:hypothetical protein